MTRAHAQTEGDVLEHAHVPEERVVLKHKPDAALARALIGGASSPCSRTVLRVGRFESRHNPQHRRFAAARRPEERHELPRRHVEG